MELPQNNHPGNTPHPAEASGNVQNGSESFRTVPHASASFGKVPNDSERFRSVPHPSERKQNHTLTVREVARMFEVAGVARTERSITNWCQPNRTGVARLDAYFDPNERKYFVSPQSVELAIAEEKAKAAKINEPSEPFGKLSQDSEPFRTVPQDAETTKKTEPASEGNQAKVLELEKEVMDLRILNKGKDFFIEQLQNERQGFFEEVVRANRKVGELENRLLQLDAGKRESH
ncbi:MAG: hypothetical protein P4N60_06785 [Verrucomicrobiae bacterium]|nr:hypothetical protein [Verrucomicrobiae bacterium]